MKQQLEDFFEEFLCVKSVNKKCVLMVLVSLLAVSSVESVKENHFVLLRVRAKGHKFKNPLFFCRRDGELGSSFVSIFFPSLVIRLLSL